VGVIDDDFAFLVTTAHRLIGHLSAEVSPHIEEAEHGAALARHIGQTLEAITRRVDRENTRFAKASSPLAKSTLAKQVRFLVSLTWGIHEAMPWLDPPHRQLDLGTRFLIDEAALAMIGPPVGVIPVESPYYMYWTLSWPFEELWGDSLKESMPRGTRPIVLAYPAREATSALLHGAFMHELGHPAVDHHNLLSAVADSALSSPGFISRMDVIFGEGNDATTVRNKRSITKRVEDWIEELICDQLALAFLGPSFLFCFAGMALPVTWNEPQDQHPNATMRVRFMVNTVTERGWDELLNTPVPRIWEWFQEAATIGPSLSDPVTQLLVEVCEGVESEIRQNAERVLGDLIFDSDSYLGAANRIAELLDNEILPAQLDVHTAADHCHILLSGWLHVIKRHGGTPRAIPASLKDREYQRFIAKALEMSTTFRAWNRVQANDPAEARGSQ
jgi:hypothetical protein